AEDLISDGQVRAGMVEIFASRLSGVRMRERPEVFAEIEHIRPITLAHVEHAIRLTGGSGAEVKGIVTGPFTMAMSVTDRYYGSSERLAFAFAEALNREVLALCGIVGTVQVDEPFLSVEYPEYARELVETVFRGAHCERALHVCGDVTPVFDELIEMPVDLLDHEFYKQEGLLTHVAELDFRQRLGYGAVDSTSTVVEDEEDVVARIERALQHFPPERLVIDPDCGLRHLPEVVAAEKLKVLVRAARTVERRSDDG
ncbi:MAG TPA: methionine synthase, partial [Thermoplasmata archaeon]|nr:methionine synthase [Thermoplasmata archaeon]